MVVVVGVIVHRHEGWRLELHLFVNRGNETGDDWMSLMDKDSTSFPNLVSEH